MPSVERPRLEHLLESVSGDLLSTVLGAVPVGLVIYDAQGAPVFVNDAFLELIGTDHARVAGSRIMESIHGDDAAAALDHWRRVSAGESVPPVRFRFVRPDGGTRWTLGHTSELRDRSGQVVAYLAAVLDLTSTIESERAAQDATRYADTIIEYSSDIITLLEADGTWRSSSHSGSRILGYPRGYDPPGGVFSLLHPDDVPAAHRALAAVIAGTTDPSQSIELRLRNVDGDYRIFDVVAVNLLAEPRLGAVLLSARDITERKAAERALEQSEARFADLVAQMHEGVWTIDADGRSTFVNARLAEMLHCTPDEILGTHLGEWIHADEIERALAMYQRQLAGRSEVGEFRFVRRDRSILWALVAATPVFSDGAVVGASAVLTDITALKATEQALGTALGEAREAIATKNHFLSTVSHELRTPLNGVLGYAELLQGRLQGADAQYLENIVHAGKHLLRLIDDLLDVGRVEAGTLDVALAPTDLGAAACRALGIVEAALDRGVQSGRVQLGSGLTCHVQADPDRLVQVLVNLLTNAYRYGDGAINVSAEPVDRGGTSMVRCQISDEGVGIAPVDRERVFEVFVQLGANRQGTGIGLAVSRALVEAMGGSIGITDSAKGAVVWFELPACAPPPGAGTSATPATTLAVPELLRADQAGPTVLADRVVLCVEDDPANRDLVWHALAGLGCRLEFATTMNDALRMCADLDPDLVLLDALLPDGNGIDVLPALRTDARRTRSVVLVTADATATTIEQAYAAGATDVVLKPFRLQAFAAGVRRLLTSDAPSPE